MNQNKSELVEHTQDANPDNKTETPLISPEATANDASERETSPQFFKLAKKFMIDGALVPDQEQTLIEDRTFKRAKLEQLRKQNNIENIMQKTLAYCENFEISQKTDLDWFSRYIALSEGVSNATMQDLWAKILASELTNPGSFSYKALKVFRDMSIHDAKLLAKACSLSVTDNHHKNYRLITSSYQKPGLLNFFSKQRQQFCNLSQFGLKYSDLLALSESHLIYLQESESSLIKKGEILPFNYNGIPFKLEAKRNDVCIQFYKFTPLGIELAHLINDKTNHNFFEHLKDVLSHNFITEELKKG